MTEDVVTKKPSKISNYFDIDLRTVSINTILGIIAGYISFTINQAGLAVLAMLIILAVATLATKKLLKIKQEKKWWLGNAVIVYILVWLVVWTILFNVVIR